MPMLNYSPLRLQFNPRVLVFVAVIRSLSKSNSSKLAQWSEEVWVISKEDDKTEQKTHLRLHG